MSTLKITNGTTANSQMTITAANLTLYTSAGVATVVASVNVTVSSGTSGVNGLDTGTVAASKWYYLYVINNGTTTAGLMSLSAAAPTLPSGYTSFQRVGTARTDASIHFYRLLQLGNQCRYHVTPSTNTANYPLVSTGLNGAGNVPGALAAVTISNFAPSTAALVYYAGGTIGGSGTDSGVMIAPNNNFGAYGDGTNPVPLLSGDIDGSCYGGLQPESASVYVSTDSASYIVCCGWEDNF